MPDALSKLYGYKMKKLLLICLVTIGSLHANGWSKSSPEQTERHSLMMRINSIREQAARMGAAASSPICQSEIFHLLKSKGSVVAYKILQEMVASRELPASYLNMA